MRRRWSFEDIPDQTGRTAVVTGANTGIGFETARMLALKGAKVVLACRTASKGEAAVDRIREELPTARVQFMELDLGDLESVDGFAEELAQQHPTIDLLILNAGVMVPPFSRTKQGFELQFGTNHLGHFALAGKLLPVVRGRIVVVSSTAAHMGRVDFEDLNYERKPYRAWAAYGQSKLANQLFALELSRRLADAGSNVRVTAAHPGWTATDLQRTTGAVRLLNPIFAMKPSGGALPTLRAATDPDAPNGSYWGPSGLFEMRGPPAKARLASRAHDAEAAARLFEVSEALTGVSFSLSPARVREAS